MRDVLELAERRGIRRNCPGMCASTTGMERESERVERRGIRLNSPGIATSRKEPSDEASAAMRNQATCDGYVPSPARPTDCPSAAASAPHNSVKKPTISRAKRSAAWACSARWLVVSDCHPHDCITSARNHAAEPAFGGITPSTRSGRHDGRSVGTTPGTRARCPRRAFSSTGGRTTLAQRVVSTTSRRTTPALRASARRRPAPRAFKNRA
jgi:hypothetical protein